MGLNFLEWSRILIQHNFLKPSSRIIGLTSEGSKSVLSGYAAVACAKATLETACKYLAVKLAARKITVNLINAGITETKALSRLPDYDVFITRAKKRNPSGRLTQPEDVAKVVFLMCLDESAWITGEVIRVDGGEQLLSV
jgi:enoyl-[acyl-carrier protein] reductase I